MSMWRDRSKRLSFLPVFEQSKEHTSFRRRYSSTSRVVYIWHDDRGAKSVANTHTPIPAAASERCDVHLGNRSLL